MPATPNKTVIPAVPLRTPMFDESGNLTRTWIIFFEHISKAFGGGGQGLGAGPYIRTLLIKDTTVANDIADHVEVFNPGIGIRILATLRKAITVDLTVKIHKGADLMVMTIPLATPVGVVLSQSIGTLVFQDKEVISADVLASDGSKDADGIASFTVEWEPVTTATPVPVVTKGLTLIGPVLPAGVIDGANAVFTLPDTPTGFLQLFVNGVKQILGTDFTLIGPTITFANAPSAGALIEAYYAK